MGMRYYSPTLMRWSQPDPQEQPTDPVEGGLYPMALGLGVTGMIGSADERLAALLVPAGALLVAAAVVDDGRWRFKPEPAYGFAGRPGVRRVGVAVVGVLWAILGLNALWSVL
jgi:hypothetical protein